MCAHTHWRTPIGARTPTHTHSLGGPWLVHVRTRTHTHKQDPDWRIHTLEEPWLAHTHIPFTCYLATYNFIHQNHRIFPLERFGFPMNMDTTTKSWQPHINVKHRRGRSGKVTDTERRFQTANTLSSKADMLSQDARCVYSVPLPDIWKSFVHET